MQARVALSTQERWTTNPDNTTSQTTPWKQGIKGHSGPGVKIVCQRSVYGDLISLLIIRLRTPIDDLRETLKNPSPAALPTDSIVTSANAYGTGR